MRYFEFSTLGKFSVVMADPPWDIHMELPYGKAKVYIFQILIVLL